MSNIVKKIKEIKFSLLSPSEIKALSVVEIIYPEIVDTNGENKIGGLSDLRMGPIDLNTFCPTCNQTCDICPGHFGHIELAEPVFHIHFFQIIQKLLRCICWKCSNLLINPDENPNVFKIKNNKIRFHLIYKLITKNKSKIENCVHCNYPQPLKYYKDKTKSSVAKIIAKFDDNEYVFTPNTIYRIFSHITDDICNLIGFNYILSRPEWTICKVLPVPPPAVRPSVKPDSQTHAEDDLTHKLAEIIKINNQVKQRIEQNYDEKIINQYIDVLQYHIATYVDNELPNTPQSEQRSGRPLKGIIQRLKGKHGRIRGNLMGKRVNFSGRSVITGDPNIEVDQVGIPFEIAMNLTFPETVTNFNKQFLYTLIHNGTKKHPGANSIQSIRPNGQLNKPRDLTYIHDRSTIILNVGDIVNRHLVDDDIILFNRQPSLHRMSMMGHRVKVMKGKSFRMNVNACPPYNSDFDGDEMNIHVPQSYQTVAELRQLAYLPNHMINPKHNTPILGCNFDFIVGSYLLTQDSVKFNKKTFMELAGWIKDFDGDISKITPDSNGQYSGKQLYSLIIPNINLNKRKNTADLKNLFIQNGDIKSGIVDKKTIGKSASGIVHILWNDYGPLEAKKFIDNVAYVVNNYLLKIGFSVGISDIVPEKDIKNETNRLMQEKLSEVDEIINKANDGILKKVSNKTTFEDFETQLIGVLGSSIQITGEYALNNIKKDNRVKRLVDSGSKGSSLNIAQMLAGLGQQSIENTRIPRGMYNRTLPHYFKYDVGAEAGGFIKNSYMDGLSPQEYYFHAIAARIGMIDTAIKTAKTGYITRKLVKAVEDISVCYDTTVRNSTNSIIQFIYGDDGLDSQKLEPVNYPLLKISDIEFNNRYNFALNKKDLDPNTKKIVDNEFEQLKNDRNNVRNDLFHKNKELLYNHIFLSPIVFIRLIQFIKNNISIQNPIDLTPKYVIDNVNNLINDFKTKISLNYHINDISSKLSSEVKNASIIKLAIFLRAFYSSKQLIDVFELSKESFDHLILETKNKFYQAIAQPGDMVGVIAAHSASESTMQMTLNSFSYDTLIIVRKNDIAQKIQIGEFVEKFIKYGRDGITNLTYYEDKDTTYAPTNDDLWEIQAPDENGNIDWYKIEAGTQHPVVNKDGSNTVIKVTTENAQEIIATKAKSFLTLQDGKLKPTRGDEINVGDYLPISVKNIDHKSFNTLNIKSILSPTEYMYGSEAHTAMKYWDEPCWWMKYHNKKFTLPYKRSDTFRDRMKMHETRVEIQNGFIYPKKTWKNSSLIPEIIELDYNFGYLIGSYCAEGCITRTQISISNIINEYFIPIEEFCNKYKITYKKYVHNDKPEPGWTSGDIRIYSIILRDIIEKLCGKLSHNKFVHDNIIFSNEECKKGFLNGYLGGDDSINYKSKCISAGSTSYKLLNDISVLLKTMGIYSFLRKNKKQTSNNRGTKSENIHQMWTIYVQNASVVLLSSYLTEIPIEHKAENAKQLINYKPKHKFNRWENKIPNLINEQLVLEDRNDNMKDVLFVKIKSIEEIKNTTDYVYDLTVNETKTFLVSNGLCCFDTFHYTGISSKSQTTTGVPRITEIISLSKNLKSPSMTIYIKSEDPNIIINSNNTSRIESINKIKSKIEYTSFKELVNNSIILYDPDITNTCIDEDKDFIESYLAHCKQFPLEDKWLPWTLRIELNREKMVSKNIILSDIDDIISSQHYANCIYSDENASKIILRIILEKKDYMKTDIDNSINIISIYEDIEKNLMNNLKINGIDNIENVNPYPDDIYYIDENTGEFKISKSKNDQKTIWMMDTSGTNLKELYKIEEIDPYKSISNSISEIYDIFGIEGARQVIINELHHVISEAEKSIDYHHINLIADHMTNKGILTSIDRHGMNQTDKGPLTRASFEETSVQLINAATFCEIDNIKGVTANIMTGQLTPVGTGESNIVLDESVLKDISNIIEKNKEEQQNYINKFENYSLSTTPLDSICKNIFNFNFDINNSELLPSLSINSYNPLIITN